jgi:hypothetical protein
MASNDVFRQNAIGRIEALRETVLAGDGLALLGALRICANFDLAMPDWLAQEFIQRYDHVLNCDVKSWDEAFGRPYEKGAHLNALRKRRRLRFAVYNAVVEITKANPEQPIDEGLFGTVGAKLHIGKTMAAELYYEAKRMLMFTPES